MFGGPRAPHAGRPASLVGSVPSIRQSGLPFGSHVRPTVNGRRPRTTHYPHGIVEQDDGRWRGVRLNVTLSTLNSEHTTRSENFLSFNGERCVVPIGASERDELWESSEARV